MKSFSWQNNANNFASAAIETCNVHIELATNVCDVELNGSKHRNMHRCAYFTRKTQNVTLNCDPLRISLENFVRPEHFKWNASF